VRTSDFSHDDVIRSTRGSLKKLATEYVDLLLMH
jgi:diketogulonate reductase-like aldo/keto reductase